MKAGRIYRTLHEANAIDDFCGRQRLRFPRSMQEAGMAPGGFYDDEQDGATRMLGGVLCWLLVAVAAVVAWAVLR